MYMQLLQIKFGKSAHTVPNGISSNSAYYWVNVAKEIASRSVRFCISTFALNLLELLVYCSTLFRLILC